MTRGNNTKIIKMLLPTLVLGGQLLYAYNIYVGMKSYYTLPILGLMVMAVIYGMLVAYFFSTGKHDMLVTKLLLITTILQFFILYYPLINPLPRRPNTYRFLGHLDYIVKYNHINPSDIRHLDYHAWPAFFLFEYSLVSILDISAVKFLWAFPIIIKTLLVLLLVSLYNKLSLCLEFDTKLGRSISQLSLIFFMSSLWININGEPQHLGYLFFVLTHFYVLTLIHSKKGYLPKILLLMIITYGVFTFTHGLYSLVSFLVSLIILILLASVLSIIKNNNIKVHQHVIEDLVISSGIMFLFWLLFGAYSQISEKGPAIELSILQWIAGKLQITPKPVGDFSAQFYFRLVDTTLVLFGGLIGSIYLLIGRIPNILKRKNAGVQGICALYLGVGLLVPFLVYPLSLSYGDEIRTRIFYLSLPLASFGLSYFILRLRYKKIRRTLCYVFIIVIMSVSFPAEYLNENINHVRYSDLTGTKFAYAHFFEQSKDYGIYAPGTVPLHLKYYNVSIMFTSKERLGNCLPSKVPVLIINALFKEQVKLRAFQLENHYLEYADVIAWNIEGNIVYINDNNFKIVLIVCE